MLWPWEIRDCSTTRASSRNSGFRYCLSSNGCGVRPGDKYLEVVSQFGEAADDEQFLSRRGGVDFFVFQYPGVAVRHEGCVQARGQSGIDVRLRAVAHHPGCVEREFVLLDYPRIGSRILFSHDLDRSEIFLQAGALDF